MDEEHGTAADGLAEPDDPLISPCMCDGGSKYVHRRCLQLWREASLQNGTAAYYQCEVCHYKYQFRRMAVGAVLGSPWTAGATFALALAASSFVLGFVPIIQALLDVKSSLLLHLADGLILVGLIGFLVMLASGCREGGGLYVHPYGPIWCYDCGGGACAAGEAGAGCLVVMVAVAAVGLVFTVLYGYRALYAALERQMGRYQVMVENVGRDLPRHGQGGAARGGQGAPQAPPVRRGGHWGPPASFRQKKAKLSSDDEDGDAAVLDAPAPMVPPHPQQRSGNCCDQGDSIV